MLHQQVACSCDLAYGLVISRNGSLLHSITLQLTGSVPLAYAALYGSSMASDAMPFTALSAELVTQLLLPQIHSMHFQFQSECYWQTH
jgi:hypothetical protein